MASIEYIMEEKKKRAEKNASKLLKNFTEIEGLEEILKKTLELNNSKTLKDYMENVISFPDTLESYHKNVSNFDFLRENFHIVEYAKVLKRSKTKIIFFQGWGDKIIFDHFELFFTFCSHLLSIKRGSIEKITINDGFYLTEKIMALGYKFNMDIDVNQINEEYFKQLKNIKWDKKTNKLFEKLYSIHGDMISYIIAKPLSSLYYANISSNRFILTFLVACNAVNNGRDRMVVEDVILAFKTFYKLIDADIDDLI